MGLKLFSIILFSVVVVGCASPDENFRVAQESGIGISESSSEADGSSTDTPSLSQDNSEPSSETEIPANTPDSNTSENSDPEQSGEEDENLSTDTPDTNLSQDNETDDINETDIATQLKRLYLSGVAIDGEVQGASVKVGDKNTTTDSSGNWKIGFIEGQEEFSTGEVAIRGGIDKATGEAFEGELKAYVDSDDMGDENDTSKSKPVTPLTTVVNAMVKTGLDKNSAKEKLAKSLGLPPAVLDANPIAMLKSGTAEERAVAAKAVKKALVVQKFTESMTKSISKSDSSEDDKLSAFDSVISAVAQQVSEAPDEDNGTENFDDVFANPEVIAQKTVESMKKKKADNNQTVDDSEFASLTEKLKVAGEVTKSVVVLINSIDEKKLAESDADSVDSVLEVTSKATEIATMKVEEKMVTIAEANDEDLEAVKTETKKVADALVMIGGIEAISAKVEEAIKVANESPEADGEDNGTAPTVKKTVDASDFSAFLSDDVIEEQSAVYRELEVLNIDQETILKVAVKKVEAEKSVVEDNGTVAPPVTFNFADALKEVVEESEDPNIIDFDAMNEKLQEVDTKIKEADDNMNTKIEEAKTLSIKEVVEPEPEPILPDTNITTPDVDEPVENNSSTPDVELPIDDNITDGTTSDDINITPPTPNITLTSSSTYGTTATPFTFNVSSDLEGTTFKWNSGETTTSITKYFSIGVHTISVIGTLNGVSSLSKSVTVTVTAVPDTDGLQVLSPVTLGAYVSGVDIRESSPLLNGTFTTYQYENFNSDDFCTVNSEKANGLLNIALAVQNVSFENETKSFKLIYRVDNENGTNSALFVISNLKLMNSSNSFSLVDLNESTISLQYKDENGDILDTNLSNIAVSDYISLIDNSLSLKVSNLLDECWVKDSKYLIKVVMSGEFDGVYGPVIKYGYDLFDGFNNNITLLKSSYGFQGYVEILKGDLEEAEGAPPSAPPPPLSLL